MSLPAGQETDRWGRPECACDPRGPDQQCNSDCRWGRPECACDPRGPDQQCIGDCRWGRPECAYDPPTQDQQVKAVDGGCPSAHVISSTATTIPGLTRVGGGAGLRPTSVQPSGDGPGTAEIGTPTLNAVLPGPDAGAMLAGNLARSVVSGGVGLARTPTLSPRRNLHG